MHRRYLVPGFNFGAETGTRIALAMVKWFGLEVTEGWRTWFPSPALVRREETERRMAMAS
jgi:hypothetical protein